MSSRITKLFFGIFAIVTVANALNAKIDRTSAYYQAGYNLAQLNGSSNMVTTDPLVKNLYKKFFQSPPKSKQFKETFGHFQSYALGMKDRLAVGPAPQYGPYKIYLDQGLSCFIEAKDLPQAYRSLGELIVYHSASLQFIDTKSLAQALETFSSAYTISTHSKDYKLGKDYCFAAMNDYFTSSQSNTLDSYEKELITFTESLQGANPQEAFSRVHHLLAGFKEAFNSFPLKKNLAQVKEEHKKIMISLGFDISELLFRFPDALKKSTLASLVQELGETLITCGDKLASLS